MIPYNSILTGMSLEDRNITFNKALDPETQRKEIALDALQLVLFKKVSANAGGYWNYALASIFEPDSKLFQDILINKLPADCEVCQRGLMMLSQIRLGNEISCKENNRDNGHEDIIKGFSMNDFTAMEAEYEGYTAQELNEDDDGDDFIDQSLPYGKHSWQKLANICCNIIQNGNFVKDDQTDYLTEWELTRETTQTKSI